MATQYEGKSEDLIQLRSLSNSWVDLASRVDFAHSLSWFGLKVYQVPTDLYLYQLVIEQFLPDFVIETGVAEGGSILALGNLMREWRASRKNRWRLAEKGIDPDHWKIVGIDTNIRRGATEAVIDFGLQDHIELIEASSSDPRIVQSIRKMAGDFKNPIISLDSDHSHSHVLRELQLYSEFISKDGLILVWDSGIGRLSDRTHEIRPRAWSRQAHAGTAVIQFVNESGGHFAVDYSLAEPLLLSSIEGGVIRKV